MQHVEPRGERPKPAPGPETLARPAKLGSAALARLIEEVRVGEEIKLDAYNRTYHRHNR